MSTPSSNDPRLYEFFQFVREQERQAAARHVERRESLAFLGTDAAPSKESLRFRVETSLGFPASSISRVQTSSREESADSAEDNPNQQREVFVTFLGLVGASGVLPEHYTATILQRLRQRDTVLQEFLDLFHHRILSLFYRAWVKYHLTAHFERARLTGEADHFTTALMSLAGYGSARLRNRTRNRDEVMMRYAGHFSHRPRTSGTLARILSDYFQFPARIKQFQGHWLRIARQDQTHLPKSDGRNGQFHQLGQNAVLGDRLWDIQTMFRLTIGPLPYRQFQGLLPNADLLERVAQFTRSYIGSELEFDIQLELKSGEAPGCRLGVPSADHRLGWNSWLGAPRPGEVVRDAVFFSMAW